MWEAVAILVVALLLVAGKLALVYRELRAANDGWDDAVDESVRHSKTVEDRGYEIIALRTQVKAHERAFADLSDAIMEAANVGTVPPMILKKLHEIEGDDDESDAPSRPERGRTGSRS